VYGSVIVGTDTVDSDLDLLIDEAPGQRLTLFDVSAIFCEIEDLLGIPVDVSTSRDIPESERERINQQARPV
jgi:predicted nucleotidyltransferase